MAPNFNPYEVLGIQKGCTDKEIQQAYRKQCLKWHPDKNLDKKEEAEHRFIQAKEAFEFLYDKVKREEYDSSIEKAERREAMYKQRMEKSDGERRTFIEELNRREKEAFDRQNGTAEVVSPHIQAAREKARAKKLKADFEELRKRLEKEAEEELRRKEEYFSKARTDDIIQPSKQPEPSKLKVKWTVESGDYNEAEIRKLFEKYGSILTITSILPTKGGKGKLCVIEFSPNEYPIDAESEQGTTSNIKATWIDKPVRSDPKVEVKLAEPAAPQSDFAAMSYEQLYAELFTNVDDPAQKKARLE